jgi:hypothetical protein
VFLNLWYRLHYFLQDFAGYLIFIAVALIAFIFASLKVFRSNLSDNKKKIILASFFVIFSIILIYSGLEAYFRYSFDESDSLGFLKVNGKWFKRHVIFNNYHVRDRNFESKKKEGTIRIGVIGDSIAMGYGIKNVEDRFSNILEKKLKDEKFNVEVYNLGKSGYDLDVEVEEYNNSFGSLDFDIIVWQYFLNDAQPKEKSEGTKVLLKEQAQSKLMQFISNYSYFFDYVYWRLAARYDKTFKELRNVDINAYKSRENFSRHENTVISFINQLKKENRKIVVVVFPFIVFLPDYPAVDIHKRMSKVFEKEGVRPIDLLDDLKNKQSKDLVVSQYDFHPNEFVHKIAAQRLYDRIVHLLK